MRKAFRVGFRLGLVAALFLTAFLDFVLRLWMCGRAASIPARARWLHFWARGLAWIVNLKVDFQGEPPKDGILVSNHLGYLDILVYGSIQPLVFLAKSEVRSWPGLGPLTRCGGTLYIRRDSRADVVRLGADMVTVVNAGVVVALFLEGTSSAGEHVLPFRSSLLAPAQEHGWKASPAWIHYELADGSVADEVCYWRDMTFTSHFLNLLSKRRIQAFVSFGSAPTARMDRKEMARELHARVCRLKDLGRQKGTAAGVMN